MPETTAPAPAYALADIPRSPADHRVTIAQIGQGYRMRMGMREWVSDDKNGELRCRIGMGARTALLIIVLGADDLYHVEIGQFRKLIYKTRGTVSGIFGDMLGESIDRLWSDICGG